MYMFEGKWGEEGNSEKMNKMKSKHALALTGNEIN